MTTSKSPTPNTTPRTVRRWFNFSLRTLLITVALVAISISLILRHANEQREIVSCEKEAVAAFEKHGGGRVVHADHEQPVLASYPAWLRAMLGDDVYRPVIEVYLGNTEITDADLSHISECTTLQGLALNNTRITNQALERLSILSALEWLDLSITSITDLGMAHLSKLTMLKAVSLSYTSITDAGFAHLSILTKLEWLDLNNTKITDAGLVHLSNLTTLQSLFLDGTCITDAGLAHLTKLSGLKYLDLRSTSITDDGLANLKATLPTCNIDR